MILSFWSIVAIVTIIVVFSTIGWKNLYLWQIICLSVLIYLMAPVLAGIALIYVLFSLAKR